MKENLYVYILLNLFRTYKNICMAADLPPRTDHGWPWLPIFTHIMYACK